VLKRATVLALVLFVGSGCAAILGIGDVPEIAETDGGDAGQTLDASGLAEGGDGGCTESMRGASGRQLGYRGPGAAQFGRKVGATLLRAKVALLDLLPQVRMVAKISISVPDARLLEWARARAERDESSLSAVFTEAVRFARQQEARDRYLELVGSVGPLTAAAETAIRKELQVEPKKRAKVRSARPKRG